MSILVYLEIGAKRTFAGAIEWPGWCRSGRDEDAALQALLAYGPRYRDAVRLAAPRFRSPASLAALRVVERLKGDASTDFGVPAVAPKADAEPVDAAALRRLSGLLDACWETFDRVAVSAQGRTLRTGPRGGGRNLAKMVDHVIGGQESYLSRLGWPVKGPQEPGRAFVATRLRQAAWDGMVASAAGEIPATGPRGGARWTVRYFVRRAAWHVLDHAWEIEDRLP